MRPSTITKTYRGSLETATRAFNADVPNMARQGYYPVSQMYAPGSYRCADFLVALLLAIVIIGILMFVYMLIVKPAGGLVVTYEYRGVTTAGEAVDVSIAIQPGERPCPHCGQPVFERAAVCRHCGRDIRAQ